MKSFFLTAILATATFFANANNIEPGTPTAELHDQVEAMIQKSTIWKEASENVKLIVTFTINNQGEIVILSTDNHQWDFALKNLLNYKKIKTQEVVKNKVFHLPISLEKIS